MNSNNTSDKKAARLKELRDHTAAQRKMAKDKKLGTRLENAKYSAIAREKKAKRGLQDSRISQASRLKSLFFSVLWVVSILFDSSGSVSPRTRARRLNSATIKPPPLFAPSAPPSSSSMIPVVAASLPNVRAAAPLNSLPISTESTIESICQTFFPSPAELKECARIREEERVKRMKQAEEIMEDGERFAKRNAERAKREEEERTAAFIQKPITTRNQEIVERKERERQCCESEKKRRKIDADQDKAKRDAEIKTMNEKEAAKWKKTFAEQMARKNETRETKALEGTCYIEPTTRLDYSRDFTGAQIIARVCSDVINYRFGIETDEYYANLESLPLIRDAPASCDSELDEAVMVAMAMYWGIDVELKVEEDEGDQDEEAYDPESRTAKAEEAIRIATVKAADPSKIPNNIPD
jgi:hypothetical protein